MDVLDACERLLRERRFDVITIEDIANAADIKIGSLYHFFQDKTAVLVSVLERVLLAEADAFRPVPEDADRSLPEYLHALETRLRVMWQPRIAVLDLYYAYQRHPLVWASVLKLRGRVARDVAAKLRRLYPRLSAPKAIAVGEQIGIVITVLIDNLAFVGAVQQRRLRRECLAMLTAYVTAEA
jgi:AcrR family transcriptional regulator